MYARKFEHFCNQLKALEDAAAWHAFPRAAGPIAAARTQQIDWGQDGIPIDWERQFEELLETVRRQCPDENPGVLRTLVEMFKSAEEMDLRGQLNTLLLQRNQRFPQYGPCLIRLMLCWRYQVDQSLRADDAHGEIAPGFHWRTLFEAGVFDPLAEDEAHQLTSIYRQDGWLRAVHPRMVVNPCKLSILAGVVFPKEQQLEELDNLDVALCRLGERNARAIKAAGELTRAFARKNLPIQANLGKEGVHRLHRRSCALFQDYYTAISHRGLPELSRVKARVELAAVERQIEEALGAIDDKDLRRRWDLVRLSTWLRHGDFHRIDAHFQNQDPASMRADLLCPWTESKLEQGKLFEALPLLAAARARQEKDELTRIRVQYVYARTLAMVGLVGRAEDALSDLCRNAAQFSSESIVIRASLLLATLRAERFTRHSQGFAGEIQKLLRPLQQRVAQGDPAIPVHLCALIQLTSAVLSEKRDADRAADAGRLADDACSDLFCLAQERRLDHFRASVVLTRLLRRAGKFARLEEILKTPVEAADGTAISTVEVEASKTSPQLAGEIEHTQARAALAQRDLAKSRGHWLRLLELAADVQAAGSIPVDQHALSVLRQIKPTTGRWVDWNLLLQAVAGLAEVYRLESGQDGPLAAVNLLRAALEECKRYEAEAAGVPVFPEPVAPALPEPVPELVVPTPKPKRGWWTRITGFVKGRRSRIAVPTPPRPLEASPPPPAPVAMGAAVAEHVFKLPPNTPLTFAHLHAESAGDPAHEAKRQQRRSRRARLLLQLEMELLRVETECAGREGFTDLPERLEHLTKRVRVVRGEQPGEHLPSVIWRAIAQTSLVLLREAAATARTPAPAASAPVLVGAGGGNLLSESVAPTETTTARPTPTSPPTEANLVNELLAHVYEPALLELHNSQQSDRYEAGLNKQIVEAALERPYVDLLSHHCRSRLAATGQREDARG